MIFIKLKLLASSVSNFEKGVLFDHCRVKVLSVFLNQSANNSGEILKVINRGYDSPQQFFSVLNSSIRRFPLDVLKKFQITQLCLHDKRVLPKIKADRLSKGVPEVSKAYLEVILAYYDKYASNNSVFICIELFGAEYSHSYGMWLDKNNPELDKIRLKLLADVWAEANDDYFQSLSLSIFQKDLCSSI